MIDGTPTSSLNAYICIFNIDASAGPANQDETGVAGATDISPVGIDTCIRFDPESLARQAFTEIPNEILQSMAGADIIMASIRNRLSQWWTDVPVMTGDDPIGSPQPPRKARRLPP